MRVKYDIDPTLIAGNVESLVASAEEAKRKVLTHAAECNPAIAKNLQEFTCTCLHLRHDQPCYTFSFLLGEGPSQVRVSYTIPSKDWRQPMPLPEARDISYGFIWVGSNNEDVTRFANSKLHRAFDRYCERLREEKRRCSERLATIKS
jgi:hypothetical protein